MDKMFRDVGDLASHVADDLRKGEFHMTIAQKLSWELVALNELDERPAQRAAAEVAYGVALIFGDQPDLFSACMSSVIEHVTDPELKRLLRLYTSRGLRK